MIFEYDAFAVLLETPESAHSRQSMPLALELKMANIMIDELLRAIYLVTSKY